jgi:hypothetical protein
MSLTKYAEMYEKMLQNPENRKRSHIRQPMPGDAGIGVDTPAAVSESKSSIDEEDSWIKEVDRKMSLKKAGATQPVNEVDRLTKIEKDINELKELMTKIMDTQMKLISKK